MVFIEKVIIHIQNQAFLYNFGINMNKPYHALIKHFNSIQIFVWHIFKKVTKMI